jgi:hypothetical protein
MLKERWPMACGSQLDSSHKHVYTIPWSFEQLDVSMLAKNDTTSVCPNVRELTVDVPYKNLAQRFPNIHTLIVLSEENVSRNDCVQFRRLDQLLTTNINMVPSPARRIHTLALFETNELLNYPTIHSNVQHLVIATSELASLAIVRTLVQHFPNIHSLDIELPSNDEYYDSLDVILDHEQLPNLSLLRTNWIGGNTSDIHIWIAANTPLKWKLTPVYGNYNEDGLTICL